MVFPRARGIELMLVGGMRPTSVTTTVTLEAGVRSYRGSIMLSVSDGLGEETANFEGATDYIHQSKITD